jgi:DNA-binding MarR family transcriptional regulator
MSVSIKAADDGGAGEALADPGVLSLARTAPVIRRSLSTFARRMRGLRADHGVSASKLSVLGQLLRAGTALSATELAQFERLQPQSLTRIIADLDSRGFILRRQNERDRRQVDIAISEAGADLLVHDARRQDAWLAEAMATKLTPAEQAILALAAELLDRLGDQG